MWKTTMHSESDLQMWKLQDTEENKTDLNSKLGGNPSVLL